MEDCSQVGRTAWRDAAQDWPDVQPARIHQEQVLSILRVAMAHGDQCGGLTLPGSLLEAAMRAAAAAAHRKDSEYNGVAPLGPAPTCTVSAPQTTCLCAAARRTDRRWFCCRKVVAD